MNNVLEDTTTGIELSGTFADGVHLKVTSDAGASDTRIVYDITLLDPNDTVVQPDGRITVKLPVPAAWAAASLYVYRSESDGSYTDMNAVLENGCMVFVTDHLSKYILTTEKLDGGTGGTDSNKPGNASDINPPTVAALVIIPALVSAAAVVFTRKRRR